MVVILYLVTTPAVLIPLLVAYHRRWQHWVERERFFLAMKSASAGHRLPPEEASRLDLLDSPWWAVWRWVPDLWRHPPPM